MRTVHPETTLQFRRRPIRAKPSQPSSPPSPGAPRTVSGRELGAGETTMRHSSPRASYWSCTSGPICFSGQAHEITKLSLDADGFDKSASTREREARKAVSGVKSGFLRGNSSASLARCRFARTAPHEPQHARRRSLSRASENGERRFHLVKMVEAVGIEPTSDGQSSQDPTSVACVSSSPGASPQAGLSPG